MAHRYTTIPLVVLCCVLSMLLTREKLLTSTNTEIVIEETEERALSAALREEKLQKANTQLEELRKQLEAAEKQNKALQVRLKACQENVDANNNPPPIEGQETSKERIEEALKSKKPQPKGRLETSGSAPRHPVCNLLSQKISATSGFVVPSTPFVWTELLKEIHTASNLLPNDPKYFFHDFTAHLLHLVSARLPRTTQTLPRTWSSWKAILDVAWKRYEYFQSHPEALEPAQQGQPPQLAKDYTDNAIPRQVNILVLGGSLLQGTNCRKMIRDLGIQMSLPLRECHWGHRLGAFLNQFFQLPLFQVTTVAVGGTNTATGSILLQHELLPTSAQHPDVIINGYSTNDMHALTLEEAGQNNITLGDQIRTMVEHFYRNATRLRACPKPPLVLHMDDYLGNQQRAILATLEGTSAVQSMARYYGFATFSYADLVRDWIYGDTHETWFSPEGWYDKKKGDSMLREIHPQLGMHLVATWVVAFNLLHLGTTFCSIEPWAGNDDILQQSYETTLQSVPQLPALRGETKYVPPGKPRSSPRGFPPRLTKTLSLEDVSELWQKEAAAQSTEAMTCQPEGEKNTRHAKCPFAWVSRIRVVPIPGVPDTENGKDLDTAVAYWKAHSVSDFGDPKSSSWAFNKDHNKIGVSPWKGVGSELLLEIPPKSATTTNINENQPLADTVTIFYMRSYGSKWKDSTIRLNVMAKSASQAADSSTDWTTLSSTELSGFHAKNTSETYAETLRLASTSSLQQLRVGANLIKGETFKIMGLLVCRLGEQD